ncbi:hypothetical protein CSE16_13945 [Solibacillus sp. R5-41]|uniref:endolytic transglycosylase MltG n=1 Tax=Solibacillus sp. R5-41 TaxID=2048654 RepID=UPI000C127634|nr:endolytic transglycosylase MltG [Solibacillus sp. R5-41]ATP41064.1 hypothetical protein CSE16_13945 [Solibacillus sp. R5-41]
MKTSFRAFGIGLFIAGASFTLYEKFGPSGAIQDVSQYEEQLAAYEKQIASLKQQLKTGNEPNVATKETKNNAPKSEQPNDSSDEQDVVTRTIYIYENMSLYDIGQQLEAEQIVKNGREIELYLSKPEFSRSIQKGAFELHSDMTVNQIAKTLTGKKAEAE